MSRIQSPGYPGTPLDEAIDLTSKLFEHNRQNPTDREAAAKDIGYSGITGTSAKVLADLSHFGLIEKTGKGGIRVSDNAVRVLHPKNRAERQRALLEAAYRPSLFRVIKEQWPDGFVSENSLRSYLMRSGFSSAALQPVMRSYQKTYAFLRQEGATESNGATAEMDEESLVEELEPAPPPRAMTSANASGGGQAFSMGLSPAPQREGLSPMSGERIVFAEETGPSQYLKLIANGDLDLSLLEALEDYVRRQKKRLSASPSETER